MPAAPPFETRYVRAADGVRLAAHHLGGDGPPVLAAHATGFHGRCWWPLAAALTGSYSVWAPDHRGHGASERDPSGRYDDWDVFAEDVLAVVDAIGGGEWRAIGHSLGGGVALLAEAHRPGVFASVACYEPVVFPPQWSAAMTGTGSPSPLAEAARRRRPSFASRQEAYDRYRSKPPFDAFDQTALEMYIDYGFHDTPEGGVTLACRREDEAACFDHAPFNPVWSRLGEVACPVLVLCGSEGADPLASVAREVAGRLPSGEFECFEDLDHFGPMTAPDRVGRAMRAGLHQSVTPPG